MFFKKIFSYVIYTQLFCSSTIISIVDKNRENKSTVRFCILASMLQFQNISQEKSRIYCDDRTSFMVLFLTTAVYRYASIAYTCSCNGSGIDNHQIY